MLLPINWLKDYIKLNLSPEKLADLLMLKSFEVEEILSGDIDLPNIIVVEILKIRRHPNADKLQLVEVSDGKKEYGVVCGAPNIKVGQKVSLAQIGAELPNGFKIEKREIRGVKSEGMICAEDELGIGKDHTGILVLSKDAQLGERVDKYLKKGKDLVLDLSITPDRNDCLSILGLAREVAALTGISVKFPKVDLKESKISANTAVKVEIRNKELCPQYFARVIKNVKVDESPTWLKERLESMGVRAINNIVDITNFVLFEYGQPLHAFDADNLVNSSQMKSKKTVVNVVVRNAKQGEKILALDGETYNLDSNMLIIADEERPIAVAGIMGGEETSVNRGTKNIILESAIFNPKLIRLTSKKLGLRSESSIRFERGFDSVLTEQAINRAAQLIQELCGGEILKGVVAPEKIKMEKKIIKLSLEYLNKLIGIEIKPQKIKSILESLGFGVDKNWNVKIPSWRQNINYPADLVEEVVRIYGYNELPDKFLVGELISPDKDKKIKWEDEIRDLMQNAGFDEVYNYSFYGEKQMKSANISEKEHLELENPMNQEQKCLRISLLPRLFEAASKNARTFDEIKVFEIGRVFIPAGRSNLPKEELRLAVIIVSKKEDLDLYREISGIISYLFDKMNIYDKNPDWVLKLGLLNEKDRDNWKIKDNASYFELDLEKIISEIRGKTKFKSLPLYPSVFRDLSITIPGEVIWRDIEELVRKSGKELLRDIEFFDIYKGRGVEEGKKSIAFHLEFYSPERTLTSEEVDEVMGGVVRALEKKLGAKLRG